MSRRLSPAAQTRHSGPAQNSLKYMINQIYRSSLSEIRHPPTFVSIVQNTVLAQDIWLEENNIFRDRDAYGVNTLPPCSKP